MKVIENGPCLNCKKHIEYKDKVKTRPDDLVIYNKLLKRSHRINVNASSSNSIKINGYARSTIVLYLCDDCIPVVDEEIAKEVKRQAQADAEKKAYWANVNANRKARLEREEQNKPINWEELRSESYNAFLSSRYWKAVKQAKIDMCGERCEQCGCTHSLHLHHTTYIHHGVEHRYLHELVLLCADCHAASHGIAA